MENLPKAIDTYQRVLELDPDDIEALGRLDALHVASGNWNELLSVLTQEAELTGDAGEALSFQYRIAELYEKRLDDVHRAVDLYQEILGIQTAHEPTLAALEKIKDGNGAPMAAALVLEPVYEITGEHERLLAALEVQVAHTEDPYGKVELLQRMALIAEDRLMDHERAFELYARAVRYASPIKPPIRSPKGSYYFLAQSMLAGRFHNAVEKEDYLAHWAGMMFVLRGES